MPREYTPEEQKLFEERYGPGQAAVSARLEEIAKLRELGDPAFQPGSAFFGSRLGGQVEAALGTARPPFPDPTGYGGRGGGYQPLTFAQTEAGQRLIAALALETERFAGKERLKLEETLQALAMDLLPPDDVETAMKQVRRGELVKSKLAFQAVLQNLADETEHAERRADLQLEEENESRTLREARARITVDVVGKDLGRAILFALGAVE